MKHLISALAISLLLLAFVSCDSSSEGEPQPDESAESGNESAYTVTVDGSDLPVIRVDAFDTPVNYVNFEYTGMPMNITVTVTERFSEYTLSPHGRGIGETHAGNTLSFTAENEQYLVLQIPGREHLFVLIDPPESTAPSKNDSNVINVMEQNGIDDSGDTDVTDVLQSAIDEASGSDKNIVYVPAGTYTTDSLYLKDNMTLYLERGAVLRCATSQADLLSHPSSLTKIESCSRGFICMNGVTNATLAGRGTLDGNGTELGSYNRKMFLVKIENSSHCTVDGILSLDSSFWNTLIYRSSDIAIRNYKVINNRLEDEWNETDGVDFNNCTDSTLYNAFLYTGDDSMAVKSDDIPDEREIPGILDPTTDEDTYINTANILHEKVVCFSGSSACKVGTKTFGDSMTGIVFRDIDIIAARRGLVIDAVDTAQISGTVFEDIRIENLSGRLIDFNMDPDAITWRVNPGECTVTDTEVTNVSSEANTECRMGGNEHGGNTYLIQDVAFSGFTIQGHTITSVDDPNATFSINEYVENITFSR